MVEGVGSKANFSLNHTIWFTCFLWSKHWCSAPRYSQSRGRRAAWCSGSWSSACPPRLCSSPSSPPPPLGCSYALAVPRLHTCYCSAGAWSRPPPCCFSRRCPRTRSCWQGGSPCFLTSPACCYCLGFGSGVGLPRSVPPCSPPPPSGCPSWIWTGKIR